MYIAHVSHTLTRLFLFVCLFVFSSKVSREAFDNTVASMKYEEDEDLYLAVVQSMEPALGTKTVLIGSISFLFALPGKQTNQNQ